MTIEKYKKYLNFKARAKYLTKDFKVPKFTGTEPEIEKNKLEEHLKKQKNKNKSEKE
jgi:hypothetical protein